jgi:hypothetical protein
MRLVEQGKLDLNARVRHYLPEFRSSDRGVDARVTLGHAIWFCRQFSVSGAFVLTRVAELFARLCAPGEHCCVR